ISARQLESLVSGIAGYLFQSSSAAISAEEESPMLRGDRGELRHGLRQAQQVGRCPTGRHLAPELQAIQIEQVKAALRVEDQVGFFEVAMRKAFLVEPANQPGRLPNQRWRRPEARPEIGAKIRDCGKFLHEQIASEQKAADAPRCGRDRTGRGNPDEFEVICRPKRAPGTGRPDEVLDQVFDFAQVESLQHQPVGPAHGGGAPRFENLRARLQELVGILEYPANRVVEERQP
ncbi:MAG: hypothetical protein DME25_04820, partial [Verrucomicrobia bacterium]